MSYLLGIDAGGSHCRARLTHGDGTVIGEARAGPANARIGLEKLHALLMSIARDTVTAAGLDEEVMPSIAVGMGIAGISRPGLHRQICRMDFPFRSARPASDAVIANLGAHLGKDGATVVLGTGSVACIRIGQVDTTIGGYGFPISDEGSGAAIGLSALRHALRAVDGRTGSTPLCEAVTARFDHSTGRAIEWMDGATPKDYADFAPMVMDHAEKNDAIACAIVEEAVRHVERFIETVFGMGAPRCALAGGLSRRLRPWLRQRTLARLSEALGDPLDGALLLARSEVPPAPVR